MSNEKDTYSNHENNFDREALSLEAQERSQELAAERERSAAENSHESVETARHEALEHAKAAEHEAVRHEKSGDRSPAERRGPASKRERAASFDATMKEVRAQMSGPSRTFSSIIHNPTVEKVSDAIGGTIARPNAIASGAIVAFIFTLAIYLVARFNGYPLSGAETIAAFALGWAVGLIYDYVRILISGKR